VLLTAAIMAVVGAAAVLQDGLVVLGSAGLVLGAALGAAFATQQRRATTPLVRRAALRDAGVAVSFVNTATTGGIAIVIVLLLQNDLGLSPATAAVAMMPLSGSVVIGSVLSRLPALTSSSVRPTVLGLLAIAAGGLILAIRHDRIPIIIVAMAIAGAGLGLASVGATSIGTAAMTSGAAATTAAAATTTTAAAITALAIQRTSSAPSNASAPSASAASATGAGSATDSAGSATDSAALGLLNTAAQLGNALGVAALLGSTALPSVGFLVVAATGLATAGWVYRSAHRGPASVYVR
jgi:hypothetical protein